MKSPHLVKIYHPVDALNIFLKLKNKVNQSALTPESFLKSCVFNSLDPDYFSTSFMLLPSTYLAESLFIAQIRSILPPARAHAPICMKSHMCLLNFYQIETYFSLNNMSQISFISIYTENNPCFYFFYS